MSRQIIPTTLILFVVLALAGCAPGTGALGTPATPAVTQQPTSEPSPSDVAPANPSPSSSPTIAPSATASAGESGAPTVAPGTPTPTPAPTPAPTGTTVVRAYFVLGSFTDNGGLVPVLREVPETKAVAGAAMRALLDGPNADEMAIRPAMYTSIPDGTRLLGVSIKGGVATVNLSSEYANAEASFVAGSANAQVVYTLTQFSTVDLVRIQVEGQTRGGALGRSDFQLVGLLPAIFVDRPAWGASLGNPGRVSGLANVFEATFRVQLLDGAGKVLVDEQVMASCGTGCWGTFRTDLDYKVSRAQYGTLRVFDLSARDGSPENVTEYRVWLTPAG